MHIYVEFIFLKCQTSKFLPLFRSLFQNPEKNIWQMQRFCIPHPIPLSCCYKFNYAKLNGL